MTFAARSIGINQALPAVISSTTATINSVQNILINTPAGAQANDFLVAFLTSTTTYGAWTSTGWTLAFGSSGTTNGYARLSCLYLPLTGAPASSYWFASTNINNGTAVVLAVRGPTSLSLSAQNIKTFSTTSSSSHVAPSVTAVANSGLLLCGYGFDRSVAPGMTATDPASMARIQYVVATGTQNYRATLVLAEPLGAVGATGTRTVTTSESVQSYVGSIIVA